MWALAVCERDGGRATKNVNCRELENLVLVSLGGCCVLMRFGGDAVCYGCSTDPA